MEKKRSLLREKEEKGRHVAKLSSNHPQRKVGFACKGRVEDKKGGSLVMNPGRSYKEWGSSI